MKRADINRKFILKDSLTSEMVGFFQQYGFIHFKEFIDRDHVSRILASIEKAETNCLSQGIKKINGTPLKTGKDENGKTIIQRFAFTSKYSPELKKLLQDPRLHELKRLLGPGSRIAEFEKDGVVFNHFVNTDESQYSKLGWHTDGLRDLFLGFKLEPMLNVGINLDDSTPEKGGLRVLPGTHNQSMYGMLFRKKYFADNTADRNELAIIAQAGDLTVHSGRIWHRVALSPLQGAASRRRVVYFPIISGKFKPKTENTRTPLYHNFQKFVK
jgi:ectoine hydroxylase-related dioxygenase (phytanoyl-CoA dioxygenase family)